MKKMFLILLCLTIKTVSITPNNTKTLTTQARKFLREKYENYYLNNASKKEFKKIRQNIISSYNKKLAATIQQMHNGHEKNAILNLYHNMEMKPDKQSIKALIFETAKNVTSPHAITCLLLIIAITKVSNILTSQEFASIIASLKTIYQTGLLIQIIKVIIPGTSVISYGFRAMLGLIW